MSKKGKYELFIVGEKTIVCDSREKIKEYVKRKGIEKIEYKMSVDNIGDLEEQGYTILN